MSLANQCHGPERITRLRVAGGEREPACGCQSTARHRCTVGYWEALPKLAQRLNVVNGADKAQEVLEHAETARDAFLELNNASGKTWSARIPDKKLQFLSLPWLPSGYGMSWRVIEAETKLRPPPQNLFVVLKFSAEAYRDPLQETLDFLRSGKDEKFRTSRIPTRSSCSSKGPRRDMVYEITNDKPLQSGKIR